MICDPRKAVSLVRKIIPCIIFAALVSFFYKDLLSFNSIISERDLTKYFYPLRYFTVNSIKSGIVPLWNPYIFSGTPHLALQQSVIFYPLSIIYYVMSFDSAFNIFLLVHIFLAGFFTYLLSKQWGMSEGPAFIAAITFMFSGYMYCLLNLASTLSSVIWLPLILLFFDKALRTGSHLSVFASGLFLAVMFLGGEPSIFYSTLWFVLLYAVFSIFDSGRNNAKKTFGAYIAVAIFGILLASVQLLPFMEIMRLTDRANVSSGSNLMTWSLKIRDTIDFIIPFFFRTDFSKEAYWKEQNWVISIYVGVMSIVLVILSIVSRKEWRIKFLLFSGLIFLFMSYGGNTPFYHLVCRLIPGFKFIRYPVRFLYLTTFAIAMLCGYGFDIYLKKRFKDQKLTDFFSALLPVLLLASLVLLIVHLYTNSIGNFALEFFKRNIEPKKGVEILACLLADLVDMKRCVAFVLAGLTILFLGARFKIRQSILSAFFTALIVADLFSWLPFTRTVLDFKTLHMTTPNVEYLKNDNSMFRFFQTPKTNQSNEYIEGKTYEDAITRTKNSLACNWMVMYGLYDAWGYDSMRLNNYHNMMLLVASTGSPSDTRILDMLNVKYVIAKDRIDPKGYMLVGSDSGTYMYKNMNVMPRSYLVGKYKIFKREEDIANRFKSKDFDPAKEVILEEDPHLSAIRYPLSAKQREKADITRYAPNEVIIDANVSSPKFLVLADQYYPGWKVYVDGKREKLYKANFVLRAVYLTEGRHTVRFLFDPFSFKLGAGITLTTLFAMLLYLFLKRKNALRTLP